MTGYHLQTDPSPHWLPSTPPQAKIVFSKCSLIRLLLFPWGKVTAAHLFLFVLGNKIIALYKIILKIKWNEIKTPKPWHPGRLPSLQSNPASRQPDTPWKPGKLPPSGWTGRRISFDCQGNALTSGMSRRQSQAVARMCHNLNKK